MASSVPSRAVFVIVASLGIVSATFVTSAAPQTGQTDRSVTPIAAPERVDIADATIPTVAEVYTLPNGDAPRLRVSFVQKREVLTAVWTDPQGKPYSRGTYRWDPATRSFKGTSVNKHVCLQDEGIPTATVVVREELSVVNDRELRDRWTKPLNVDCSVGLVKIFKWTEDVWRAVDKDKD